MNLIINPIGISLLYRILGREEVDSIQEDIDKNQIMRLKNEFVKVYNDSDINLIDLSAETNSINSMIEEQVINPKVDIIYLLHSSTQAGYVAGLVVQEILKNKMDFKQSNIILKKLENIKVSDAQAFITGASNLNNFLYKEIEFKSNNVVINITGGFKVLVPAMTMFYSFLVKSNYNAKLCYLYEKSTQIIQFQIDGDKITAIGASKNNNIDSAIMGK